MPISLFSLLSGCNHADDRYLHELHKAELRYSVLDNTFFSHVVDAKTGDSKGRDVVSVIDSEAVDIEQLANQIRLLKHSSKYDDLQRVYLSFFDGEARILRQWGDAIRRHDESQMSAVPRRLAKFEVDATAQIISASERVQISTDRSKAQLAVAREALRDAEMGKVSQRP